MHDEAMAWVRLGLLRAGIDGCDVLDIGGRDVNGSPRRLLCSKARRYLSIDLTAGRGVDLVADGATYVPTFTPDRILCCEVLEHAPNAEEIVRHAMEILAPGGWLILTAASTNREPHSAHEHTGPAIGEYYQNVTADDLRAWVDGTAEFLQVEFFPRHGDVYLLAQKKGGAA